MINEDSIKALSNSKFNDAFTRPLYEGYAFAQIPKTLKRLLTGSPGGLPIKATGDGVYDKVIAICVDGFGWSFFQRYVNQYPFLKRFKDEGIVNVISSQFPSTTVAHMTCLHSDKPVGESGIYEWFYYEPILDAPIAPLMFSYAGDHSRGTLQSTGITTPMLYPFPSYYTGLKEIGINSTIFMHSAYCNSPYSDWVCRDSMPVPFDSSKEGLNKQLAYKHVGKEYQFLYFSEIDTVSHHAGPGSQEFAKSVDDLFTILEEWYLQLKDSNDSKTALVVFADHGHIELDPTRVIYLNQRFPQILSMLETNKKGDIIVPCGSSRDFFLHVKKENLQEVCDLLNDGLKGIAEIYKTDDLIKQGFFGATVSERFLERVGNLVILPYANEQIWWFQEGRFDCHFKGSHGGLSSDEMETIFLFLDVK
ncbi:MAG: alkaline phosphatase family protein [Parachlamydiales bacterium]|nr:alkaline phosphatase family protein [Parachlamydiales bacterium]